MAPPTLDTGRISLLSLADAYLSARLSSTRTPR